MVKGEAMQQERDGMGWLRWRTKGAVFTALRACFVALGAWIWMAGGAQGATYTSASTPFSWIDASTHAKVGYNTSPY